MKVLSTADTATIRALAMCFLPRGGGIDHDAVDAGVLPFIDNWFAKLRPFEVLRIRALFRLFEHYIAVENLSPFARFSTAERDDQIAYLSTWENSSVYARRLAFQGVRSIITLAYDQHPGVQQQMGLGQSEEHLQAQASRLAEAAAMLTGAKPTRPGPAAATATPRPAATEPQTPTRTDAPASEEAQADEAQADEANSADSATTNAASDTKKAPAKNAAKKTAATKTATKKTTTKKTATKKTTTKKNAAKKTATTQAKEGSRAKNATAKNTRTASSGAADAPNATDSTKSSSSQAS